MGFFWFILSVVFIILYLRVASENSALKKENEKLRFRLSLKDSQSQFSFCTECGSKIINGENCAYCIEEHIYCTECGEKLSPDGSCISCSTVEQVGNTPELKIEKVEIIEKNIMTEEEKRNILLLTTGALFIILSAIVFLMSTWSVIPQIVKVIVLVMLTTVFFGASHIAKEKMKLEKVHQTFYYISMAYIPICLISLSLFGLLGEYLSITGEGSYLYLTVVALILSLIYYSAHKKEANNYLLVGSILSQSLSIVLFTLIFSDSLLLVGINLLIYNISLIILTKHEVFKLITISIPILVMVLSMSSLFMGEILLVILTIFLAINFFLLEKRKSSKYTAYLFNLNMIMVGINFFLVHFQDLSINYQLGLLLIYIISVYLVEELFANEEKQKNLIESIRFLSPSALVLLSIYASALRIYYLPGIYLIIVTLIFIRVYYKENDDKRKAISMLIPISLYLAGISLLFDFRVGVLAYFYFGIIIFIINEMIKKISPMIHQSQFMITNVYLLIVCFLVFILSDQMIYTVVTLLMLLGIYVYNYKYEKLFKYAAYIVLNFSLVSIFTLIKPESSIVYLIPSIVTIMIMLLEKFKQQLRDACSDGFIIIFQIISLLVLYLYSPPIVIVFTLILIIKNILEKQEESNIIFLVLVIPAIWMNQYEQVVSLLLMIMMTTFVTVISIKKSKYSTYTVCSLIYLILTMFNWDYIYFRETLLMIWSLGHYYLFTDEKQKDLFKVIFYLSILFLYNSVIYQIGLSSVTAISFAGYLAIAMLIFKDVLKKYVTDIEVLEYITFSLIYLLAIFFYQSEFDGMMFGILIIIMIIISYEKGYGSIFLVSIFAIIANMFLLTRELWFSLPWWIYLLVIGFLLIAFAIKNEKKENKEKALRADNFIKEVKNKVDKNQNK